MLVGVALLHSSFPPSETLATLGKHFWPECIITNFCAKTSLADRAPKLEAMVLNSTCLIL